MKQTASQIAEQVLDRHYGAGSIWAEPNQFDEVGFTRAQAESDIDADDITRLIEEAINIDRGQRSHEQEEK